MVYLKYITAVGAVVSIIAGIDFVIKSLIEPYSISSNAAYTMLGGISLLGFGVCAAIVVQEEK